MGDKALHIGVAVDLSKDGVSRCLTLWRDAPLSEWLERLDKPQPADEAPVCLTLWHELPHPEQRERLDKPLPVDGVPDCLIPRHEPFQLKWPEQPEASDVGPVGVKLSKDEAPSLLTLWRGAPHPE